MILFDLFREWEVAPPPRVSEAVVRAGIDSLRAIVEQACEREQPTIRWSKASNTANVIREQYGLPDTDRKRPPDLSAKHPSFSARLLRFVRDKCQGNGAVAYKRAGIGRRVYSRIISNNDASADKDTVMRLAVGLQLDQSEADELMASAGYAFSKSIPADCAFLYCIENKVWCIEQVDEILASIRRRREMSFWKGHFGRTDFLWVVLWYNSGVLTDESTKDKYKESYGRTDQT